MPSERLGAAARQHDPAARIAALRHRRDTALPFDPASAPALPLLLDTTFYLHRTAVTTVAVLAHLDRMARDRAVAPSAAAWTEATVPAGHDTGHGASPARAAHRA